MYSKDDFVKIFVKAIRQGNAAVFGGAGLSNLCSWKELLSPLASDIGLDIEKENDFLSVAQFYENNKSREGINSAIKEAFSKTNINDNIHILTRLPISTYWTTNYDKSLEQGLQRANRKPDVKSESSDLSTIEPGRDAIVYKMHGDVDSPDKAVLTKNDYDLYELKRPLFRTALKGDLISKVFLFIGFSFEDPNFDYMLSQIHSLLEDNVANHYCFFKREHDDYAKKRQDFQVNNLAKYGINVVFVESFDEITEVLREVERKYKQHNVFISGSAYDYAPWNKQDAESFATNLASALVRNDNRITSGFGDGIGSAIVNGALDEIYKNKYGHIDEYLCLHPFPQNISNPEEKAQLWTQYRESMISKTGIAIFMFGNKQNTDTNKTVDSQGCLEEFQIAKRNKNIIIPIGSTGYVAKKIWDEVNRNLKDYPYLSEDMEKLNSETNIDKIVEIIIGIIKKINMGE